MKSLLLIEWGFLLYKMNKEQTLNKIDLLNRRNILDSKDKSFVNNLFRSRKKLNANHYKVLSFICEKHIPKKKKREVKKYTKPIVKYEPKFPKALSDILRTYQKEGVGFLENFNGNGLLADEMGLGKSIQAIAYCMLHPEDIPVIIVCPASLKINWQREIYKWSKQKAFIINGTKCTGKLSHKINIINYDIVEKRSKDILSIQPKIIIMDESHKIKNWRAKRTKAITRLCKKIPKRIFLSGSPIENRPSEIWTTINILSDGRWTFPNFMEQFCNPELQRYGWSYNGATNLDKLNYVLLKYYMIQRYKKDVLKELPAKQYTELFIQIDNQVKYDKAENDFRTYFKDNVRALNKRDMLAETMLKLNELQKIAIEGKMKMAIDWIEDFLEQKKQIVIFTNHIQPLKDLRTHFGKDIEFIFGGTNAIDRDKSVTKFQSGKLKIIAGNSAMAEGLTLTSASDMLFLEFPYSPLQQLQREDRIHRISQTERVNIYKMIAGDTVDENILAMQRRKHSVINKTMQGINSGGKKDMDLIMEGILNRKK